MALMNPLAGQQWRCRHREQASGHRGRKEKVGRIEIVQSIEIYTLPNVKLDS